MPTPPFLPPCWDDRGSSGPGLQATAPRGVAAIEVLCEGWAPHSGLRLRWFVFRSSKAFTSSLRQQYTQKKRLFWALLLEKRQERLLLPAVGRTRQAVRVFANVRQLWVHRHATALHGRRRRTRPAPKRWRHPCRPFRAPSQTRLQNASPLIGTRHLTSPRCWAALVFIATARLHSPVQFKSRLHSTSPHPESRHILPHLVFTPLLPTA